MKKSRETTRRTHRGTQEASLHGLTFASGLARRPQKLSSTSPPIFSTQRGFDTCSPGPQPAEHLSQSIKSQENSGLRGVRRFSPNEYFNVTFSFGKTCQINPGRQASTAKR